MLSTIDLTKGYWQLPLALEAKEKTAFATPSGLYHFGKMPFGLHEAVASFQRVIDKGLWGVHDWAVTYIDDILFVSSTWDVHLNHLCYVFQARQTAGLTTTWETSHLRETTVQYLGCHIGQGQIQATHDKVAALWEAVRICNVL